VLLSQETERLNVIIAGKMEESKKLTLQGEEWRRKLGETGEVARRIPEYEQRIAVIIQENEKLQYALRSKTDELGGLDLKFKQLLQENDALKKNIANLEYSWSSKHESEISRRTQTYEQTQSAFVREKEDLLRRLKEAEQKVALYGQEIERLTAVLKGKTDENARLTGELESLGKKVQVRLQSTESEFSALQGNYNVVLKEYETAKRHLQEYEQSIRKLYTEFERLQGIINELKKENQTLHNMVLPP
jgi:chromosome segregation ATPase